MFREKNLGILGGSFFARGRFQSGRPRIPAAKFLADFLHRVEWSSGGGCHFAAGARERRIESKPLVDGRTKFGGNFDEAHTTALAVIFEPLNFANPLQATTAVKRKRKRHQAIGAKRANGAKTKAIFGNAEEHATVAGT